MESNLIVMKFGGTSVKNQEHISLVSRKIRYEILRGNKVVAVVSAQGDTTDRLLEASKKINNKPNFRELDVLLSAGEQISMALLAITLESLGVKAISLTGWQAGIKTCNCHCNAKIVNVFTERIEKELKNNDVVVVAGFQGINENEDITTMGRGGSDTSAVALASALKAKECRIYTDVDGVYTADPRIVIDAQKIKEISYDNMIKLADMGAKVLNKRSVRLAKKYGVEISVLTSMRESNKNTGTRVREIDFKDDPLVSAAIKEGVFILKINEKDFSSVLEKIYDNKIEILDIFFVDKKSLILMDSDKMKIIEEILNGLEYEIEKKLSKISIICTNQDNIFHNFAKIKESLKNVNIKYAYVSEYISIISDQSVGRDILRLVSSDLFKSNFN